MKSYFPNASISMLLRSYTKDVAAGYEGLSEILTYDHDGKSKSFFELLRELRLGRYDLAIVAFPRFRIALLLLLAGVPTRVATGYRWYSFLFNKRVYEHRKVGQKHESEYNLGLLRALGYEPGVSPKPSITLTEEDLREAISIMHEAGIQQNDRWLILHPGSGGSARDWKPENFALLAGVLAGEGFKIVVTGGPGEEGIVDRVVNNVDESVTPIVNHLTLKQLAAFIRYSNLFISNSTGPLHIAAAVGTPVIGFYPDIPACSPTRWGPLTDLKRVFMPDRKVCPLCKGGQCQSNVCMDQIDVSEVAQAARELISLKVSHQATLAAQA